MFLTAKFIAEDTAGHGLQLAFPNVSTCVAVVVQLDAELVGWHVTMGTLTSMNRFGCAQGAAKFVEYASAGKAARAFIVGHVQNHDPVEIRKFIEGKLGGKIPTESCDITQHRKAVTDGEYHLFFAHAGAAFPQIFFKKSGKVKLDQGSITGGDKTAPSGLEKGYLPVHDRDATFEVKNEHALLRKHFVNVV